ncbi:MULTISPECIES: cupin domain-containing protein [Gluconobacter]|uniref:Cupin n=1 Tax=Gluconobacter cerinus TaxID=38307 RepID=A0A1B6VPW4_9PROT|nr:MULTISPECIES: cupin domain-containing protein [Gluconobacter]MBS0983521.1 cupin domain-containing protein [Gluconobacter cerinus]MBS0994693.1 cupin domain-containing protein [Gluconobacter cerinus]MBS1019441.1 cupin domain-containing protein [Gluconobacter cerinus]MBS1021769.1 cupin domain-containing protein [Gluconobacter cerinus]MBS1032027.1 cupin domain-containing protein [Gluconobacter cerinus]
MNFRLSLILLSCLTAGSVAHAESSTATAHADHLLNASHSWNGVTYTPYSTSQPELSMIRLTIPPHTALPWHVHPFPNAGYVLQGTLKIEDRESGKTRTFHQGEAFAESVNDVHRGVSGDVPTVLLLTYAGVEGKPTSIPVDKQKPEY